VVPGIGTIQGLCASNQASAICAGVGLLLVGDALEEIDQGLVLLHRLGRETRQDVSEIALTELGIFVHRTGEEAFAERAVGHEADAEFVARFEDAIGFRPARPKGILVLQRGDRLHSVRPTDRLRAGFREAEMLHLALGD
jgi:hypothetical protein